MLGIKSYITLALVAVIAVAVWGILRQTNKILNPPKSKIVTENFEVVQVINGTTIEVKAGLLSKRTKFIHLSDISCLIDGPFSEKARLNLELSCGKSGVIKFEKNRVFSSVETCSECNGKGMGCWACGNSGKLIFEIHNSAYKTGWQISGVCFGVSGINLQLDQLEQGFAKCEPSAPKEWKKVEAEAKKNKVGIWSVK